MTSIGQRAVVPFGLRFGAALVFALLTVFTWVISVPSSAEPARFKATPVAPDEILLTWDSIPEANGFAVEELSASPENWTVLAQLSAASSEFRHRWLLGASTHTYRLRVYLPGRPDDLSFPVEAGTFSQGIPIFSASDRRHGQELFTYRNGRIENLIDITPGPEPVDPDQPLPTVEYSSAFLEVASGNVLYFSATRSVDGTSSQAQLSFDGEMVRRVGTGNARETDGVIPTGNDDAILSPGSLEAGVQRHKGSFLSLSQGRVISHSSLRSSPAVYVEGKVFLQIEYGPERKKYMMIYTTGMQEPVRFVPLPDGAVGGCVGETRDSAHPRHPAFPGYEIGDETLLPTVPGLLVYDAKADELRLAESENGTPRTAANFVRMGEKVFFQDTCRDTLWSYDGSTFRLEASNLVQVPIFAYEGKIIYSAGSRVFSLDSEGIKDLAPIPSFSGRLADGWAIGPFGIHRFDGTQYVMEANGAFSGRDIVETQGAALHLGGVYFFGRRAGEAELWQVWKFSRGDGLVPLAGVEFGFPRRLTPVGDSFLAMSGDLPNGSSSLWILRPDGAIERPNLSVEGALTDFRAQTQSSIPVAIATSPGNGTLVQGLSGIGGGPLAWISESGAVEELGYFPISLREDGIAQSDTIYAYAGAPTGGLWRFRNGSGGLISIHTPEGTPIMPNGPLFRSGPGLSFVGNSGRLFYFDGEALHEATGLGSPLLITSFGTGVLVSARSFDGTERLWIVEGSRNKSLNGADQWTATTSAALNWDDDKVFVTLSSDQTGLELCVVDGNSISLVADIEPGPGGANPGKFARHGDVLYFTATTSTDGTATFALKDGIVSKVCSTPGILSDDEGNAIVTDDGKFLLSSLESFGTGVEPWLWDGISPTADFLSDIYPGPVSSNFTSLVPFKGGVYGIAATPSTGASCGN